MHNLHYSFYESPIGKITLIADNKHLISLNFSEKNINGINNENPIISHAKNELELYFKGELTTFLVPILLQGTKFQQQVWSELLNIRYGETISYLILSKRIGNEKAIRAVGTANGKNPIPIIVPCHRVIGSNGNLVGFSGGIENKRWLLTHEAKYGGKTLF